MTSPSFSGATRRVGGGVVLAAAGGAVAIGAVIERLLRGGDVRGVAAPELERRLLDRARERERERPRQAAAEANVHRVQVRRRELRRLAAREERDAWDGGGYDAQEAADGGVGDGVDAALVGSVLAGQHHVRLQQHALEDDALGAQLLEDGAQCRLGRLAAALER